MVKKLLKHEFTYYFRSFILFIPLVLVFGLMARVSRSFDSENTAVQVMRFTSSSMLIVSCWALMILAAVMGVVRFYKNMYTAEGYLTFTLPVTNTAHIFTKLLASLVCQTVCLLTVGAAGCISIFGEDLVDLFKGFSELFVDLHAEAGTANLIGYIIEVIVLIVLSSASNMLLYYACITIGQTAKKNRILKAFGAYIVYYIATQIFSSIFTIVVLVSDYSDVPVPEISGAAVAHIFFCIAIVWTAIMAAVFWIVTQTIMTKKLNLE